MLAQVAMAFPEVRDVLDRAERTLASELEKPLGKFIYPPSPFTPEQEAANRKELQRTEVAQPAVGAASLGDVPAARRRSESNPTSSPVTATASTPRSPPPDALSEEDLIRLSYRRGHGRFATPRPRRPAG